MSMMQMLLGAGAAVLKPYYGDRGIWAGGSDKSIANNIDSLLEITQYISITTTGNASTGGNLTDDQRNGSSCSNGSRALYFGGKSLGHGGSLGAEVDVINYQTISTAGTCQDFGDMSADTAYSAACSNGTRGVYGGGESPSKTNVIEYVIVDTTSNASDFGDLHLARHSHAGVSNGTRGVFAAGSVDSGTMDQIEYITIDTNGNGTDLCDLNYEAYEVTGCGNRERSIVSMGRSNSVGNRTTNISYFDPTSTSNAQDFGDLTVSRNGGVAVNNETRAAFGGGEDINENCKTIDYITIASTGNATDFGDMEKDTKDQMGTSGD